MFNYSFRLGLEEKLRLFREYGFEYIHWCDDWDNDALYSIEEISRFKQSISDSGLVCQDVHGTSTPKYSIDSIDPQGRRGYHDLLENRVILCSELGGDCVVAHPPRTEGGELGVKLANSIEALGSLQSICRDRGVRLAVENCYRGDEFFLDGFLNRFEPDFLGICFDSGHANIHGNLDSILRRGERLIATHLHDNMGDSDSHQPPFWGTVDWRKVMDRIKASGYRKPLNLEDTYYVGVSEGSIREFLSVSQSAAERLLRMSIVL